MNSRPVISDAIPNTNCPGEDLMNSAKSQLWLTLKWPDNAIGSYRLSSLSLCMAANIKTSWEFINLSWQLTDFFKYHLFVEAYIGIIFLLICLWYLENCLILLFISRPDQLNLLFLLISYTPSWLYSSKPGWIDFFVWALIYYLSISAWNHASFDPSRRMKHWLLSGMKSSVAPLYVRQ